MLRFNPASWAKLLFLRDAGETEVGGFGISHPGDVLLIDDFSLVHQQTTLVSVAFDDHAVADFFEDQVILGRRPEEFARIWVHTHPGHCPQPSPTDEDTFERVFGRCDWAVMFILSQTGATYARLQWNIGPGGTIELPVSVDYRHPFAGSDRQAWQAWQAEYDRCVIPGSLSFGTSRAETDDRVVESFLEDDFCSFLDLFEEEFLFDRS